MAIFNAACFLVVTVFGITHGSPAVLDTCSQCQDMVASVNMMLSDDMWDRFMPILCEALSEDITEICSELGKMSPTKLCQKLGHCSTRNLVIETQSDLTTELEISDDLDKGLPCLMCQNFMKIAHAFLASPQHQKFILRVLKSVCHFVPFLGNECSHLVDTYGPMVIQLAVHYLSPETCKLFHICPAGKVLFGDQCKLCRFGVGVIYDAVQDPALETRLEQFTQDLCTEYVGDNDECESLAKELTGYLLPMAKELRHSDFFKNACERSNICSENGMTFN